MFIGFFFRRLQQKLVMSFLLSSFRLVEAASDGDIRGGARVQKFAMSRKACASETFTMIIEGMHHDHHVSLVNTPYAYCCYTK
jgi:hypothetical protein